MRIDPPPGDDRQRRDSSEEPGLAGPAGIVFEGAFTLPERALLSRQFSLCRFELLARSVLDERVALARWRPIAGARGRGPYPLFAPPTEATYVVDLSAAPDGEPTETRSGPTGSLPGVSRVDNTAALQTNYAGHFPGVEVKTPGWLRLRRGWHRLLPVLIVALAAVWVALLLWQMRGP